MRHAQYFTIIPALALLATAPVFGQEAGDLEGVTPEQVVELRLPTYVKAPIGSKAIVMNADEQQLGVVHDHIIEKRSGKVLFIAVGAEKATDEDRLVPYDRFTWDAKQKQLLLPMTADELRALPAYDRKTLGAVVEASAPVKADDAKEETPAKPKEQLNVASSAIFGSSVMAANEPFATVGELVLEPEHGTIAFVLASREATEGGPFVLPWQTMKWQAALDTESVNHFAIAWSADKLSSAPQLKRGDLEPLMRAATLEEIFSFYGLEMPVAKEREVVSR
jgi:hypothetical protein